MDNSIYRRPAQARNSSVAAFARRSARRAMIQVLHRRGLFRKMDAVLELEVYAAGERDLNKVLELDHEIEAVPGLRYKVDRNHDIVYMELEEPTVTFREIRSMFRKLGLDPKFVGAIPPELRPKTKTQLLRA
jgi:hypothetical protein